MQQLDALTLKALALELQILLGNAKISKVQHPSPHEFLITFWGGAPRGNQLNLFYIHLNPEAPFCVLTQSKAAKNTVLQSFAKPTSLCMLLRKHLQGASLVTVRTLPGERVIDLVFENFNELGNQVRLVLSLELMGKHTNMIFYDAVEGAILAVAHGVSESMSSHRELAAGLPYAAPPPPVGKKQLSELTSAAFQTLLDQAPAEMALANFLNANLAGFGFRMVQDALALSQDNSQLLHQTLSQLENGEQLSPRINLDGERFHLLPATQTGQAFESVNDLVGSYFIGQLQATRLKRKSTQLLAQLEQQQKKHSRRESELVPIADAEIQQLQSVGDRLLAAFSAKEVPAHPQSKEGSVTLTRYEDGSAWPIEIDPSASWIENAQIYYRRAKKAKARKDAYEQMAEALNSELDYLQNLKQLVSQAETLAELEALEADMAEAGFIKKAVRLLAGKKEGKKKKSGEATVKELSGVTTLSSSDGLEILLGKSGQGNDAIVGKLSRSDDLWLHVHQMPGSHVLVRSGQEEIPPQTLLEAASLAAYYSSARNSLNVPVIYTQCKYVRKIPQSYPGHVNYKQEKTVFISPDPALIQTLLQQEKN